MTASERLLETWGAMQTYFTALSPAEAVLNVVLSLSAVGVGMVVLYVGRRGVARVARLVPGRSTADKQVRTSRVARLFVWALRLMVGVGVFAAVANVWGVRPLVWLGATLGEATVATGIRLAGLTLVTVLLMELAGYLVGYGVGRLAAHAETRRRQGQLRTLGPLLQGVAHITILVLALMMGLGELGVKIGPLLAGAGVVGIAIGFGAQTLVKDFLTGLFLVVEDIVSVGDIVRIGDSGGLVEEMTLRTIRLRDFDGTLHVFPYGEAQVVHNLTKTFSYCVFDLQISYGSSIDQALELMRQVGDELRADPAFGDKILEPIEVVGVDNLADSGVVLKGRIKTRPLEQWTVGREYNRRIKHAFDDAGVEIPFPHMKVVLPEGQISELARH
ncbi:mechanosensitive ion channel family protein [uncultured Phenylobacterium sp.]|uniref:mechanosensitive ion channel family protein n=1 Tax=uncultured Phenylobacterium sp. TaxID=349273 RepID=UPI0025DDD8B3|nr:mechanosensitive ion channel family protein [uncultured Phenylobacterium sp.]